MVGKIGTHNTTPTISGKAFEQKYIGYVQNVKYRRQYSEVYSRDPRLLLYQGMKSKANKLYIDKPAVIYSNCDISSGVWEADFFARRLIELKSKMTPLLAAGKKLESVDRLK